MDNPVPELAPHLAKALEAFSECGVVPTSAELVWLARLRHKCDNPDDGSVPWVMGAALEYGGVKFYPLHKLARSWFARAFELLDGNDVMQIAAFLFAHHHSGVRDVTVRDYMTVDSMVEKLDEWSNAMPIHDEQLPSLCDRLRELDGQSDSVPDVREADKEAVEAKTEFPNVPHDVAVMCKAFQGSSPEFWLTGISSVDAMDMLASVSADGGWAENPTRREAVANWLRAIKWVWRNHNHGE